MIDGRLYLDSSDLPRYIISQQGDAIDLGNHNDRFLGERQSRRLRAETDWFEKLTKHAPSVGTFYEDALRSLVAEHVSDDLRVGTGFVFDAERRSASKQMDILVYRTSGKAPYYRKGDFVIVKPESVRSVAEVKKSIKLVDIDKLVKQTIFSPLAQTPDRPRGVGEVSVFAFGCSAKTERVFSRLVEAIERELHSTETQEPLGYQEPIAVTTFNVPSIYFFDRNSIISFKLDLDQSSGSYFLDLFVHIAHGKEGFPEFLTALTSAAELVSYPMQFVTNKHRFRRKILLQDHYRIQDISDRYPDDREAVRQFRFAGKRPFGVRVPTSIRLEDVSSFDSFIKIPHLSWTFAE